MRGFLRPIAGFTVGALALALLVTPASAVASCEVVSGVMQITMESAVARVQRGSGQAILVDGTQCDGATVGTIDSIDVATSGGPAKIVIDLSGGPFAPGATDEPGTSDEIEFTVDFGSHPSRRVVVFGSSGDDAIDFSADAGDSTDTAINLNAEAAGSTGEDADVVVHGTPSFEVEANDGDDDVTQATLAGSQPMTRSLTVLAGRGADLVAGGSGADDLAGGTGADQLAGAEGDDRYVPQGGTDQLVDLGGDPTDLVSFRTPNGASIGTGGITVDLEAGTASGPGHGSDTLEGIEDVSGTSFDDTLVGDGADNEFFGGAGADRLLGVGGDDMITGDEGRDVYSGGVGSDSALILTNDPVRIDLRIKEPQDTFQGHDRFRAIENLYTGSGNDDLVGNGADNILSAGTSFDVVKGRGGDDTVTNPTDERMRLTGGNGIDTLRFTGVDPVIFSLAVVGMEQPGASDLVVTDLVENVIGADGNDVLTGNALANSISGGLGNDDLGGRSGRDALDGGDGSDTCRGGPGEDVLLNCES